MAPSSFRNATSHNRIMLCSTLLASLTAATDILRVNDRNSRAPRERMPVDPNNPEVPDVRPHRCRSCGHCRCAGRTWHRRRLLRAVSRLAFARKRRGSSMLSSSTRISVARDTHLPKSRKTNLTLIGRRSMLVNRRNDRRGTRIDYVAWYDNSSANVKNPNSAPQTVHWAESPVRVDVLEPRDKSLAEGIGCDPSICRALNSRTH